MIKKVLLIVAFVGMTSLNAQDIRSLIEGTVKSDSLVVSDIHVFNRNTKTGGISSQEGRFEIKVKINDTLIFSGIQFYTKIIVIEEAHLKTKKIDIGLVQNTNELEEVVIQNKLTGNLRIDAGNQKAPILKITTSALDFTIKNSNKPYEATEEDRRFTSSDDQIPLFLGGSGGGGDIVAIVGLIISPLRKIGRTRRLEKREIKKKERIFKNKALAALDKIKEDFGEDFFVETLKIPEEHINLFIDYCKPKKIGELFVKGNGVKLVEVFIEESIVYKENNNLK